MYVVGVTHWEEFKKTWIQRLIVSINRDICKLLKFAMFFVELSIMCHVNGEKIYFYSRSPSVDANSMQFNAFWHQIRHEIDDFQLNPVKIGVEFEKKMYPYLS